MHLLIIFTISERPGGRVRRYAYLCIYLLFSARKSGRMSKAFIFQNKKLPISAGNSTMLIGRICILTEDAMKPAEAEASWHRSRDRLSACPANRGDPEWS